MNTSDLEQLMRSIDGSWVLWIFLAVGWDDVIIALALMVVSATITALTAPKPQRPEDAAPSKLGDFNLPTITEGTPQAVVFGDVWLPGWQVLWYGDLRAEAIRSPRQNPKKRL